MKSLGRLCSAPDSRLSKPTLCWIGPDNQLSKFKYKSHTELKLKFDFYNRCCLLTRSRLFALWPSLFLSSLRQIIATKTIEHQIYHNLYIDVENRKSTYNLKNISFEFFLNKKPKRAILLTIYTFLCDTPEIISQQTNKLRHSGGEHVI